MNSGREPWEALKEPRSLRWAEQVLARKSLLSEERWGWRPVRGGRAPGNEAREAESEQVHHVNISGSLGFSLCWVVGV